jgi:hypothetical protein
MSQLINGHVTTIAICLAVCKVAEMDSDEVGLVRSISRLRL